MRSPEEKKKKDPDRWFVTASNKKRKKDRGGHRYRHYVALQRIFLHQGKEKKGKREEPTHFRRPEEKRRGGVDHAHFRGGQWGGSEKGGHYSGV